MWFSVTQTLIDCQYGKVTGVKAGNVAQILVEWKSANTVSWGTGDFGVPAGWLASIDYDEVGVQWA